MLRGTKTREVAMLPNTVFLNRRGRGPVPGPVINYTGPLDVLLEFVILVF
jgi:hypothetical protein